MIYRDRLLAIIALLLSAAALTGMVHVDAYTQAAQAEANAYAMLTRHLSNMSNMSNDNLLHADDPAMIIAAPHKAALH